MSASTPPESMAERLTLPGSAPRVMPPVLVEPPPPASLSSSIGIGFGVGARRLLRRGPVLVISLAVALTVTGAVIERSVSRAGAVDRALQGAFGLIIPLLVFSLLAAVTGRARLADACWPAARYGLARREVALGVLLALVAAAAAACAALGLLSVVFAHSRGAPPLAADAITSAWIAALTGAAYAAWFALGSTVGARGGGRAVPLAADFLFAGSGGLLGAILPRGNAANLLGGTAPLGLGQPASTALLVAALILAGLWAAARCKE